MDTHGRADGALRVLLAGDVYVNRPDPSSAVAALADTLRAADITMVNQEVPLSDTGTPWASKSTMKLKAPAASVAALTFAGVDVVTLASNHTLDFGYEALESTIRTLEAAGIKHVGVGNNLAEAHAPAIVERQGTRVAFLNYSSIFWPGYEATESRPGLCALRVNTAYTIPTRVLEQPGTPADLALTPDPTHLALLEQDLRAARERADVVIVMWHWGVSANRLPGAYNYSLLSSYQVDLAHRAIDLGADLVAGAGPHVLQGVELYQGKVIAYGLGECAFDEAHNHDKTQGALLEVRIRGGTVEAVALLPLVNRGKGTFTLATGADADQMYYELRRICDPLGTRLTREGDRVRVALGATEPALAATH